ncbi:MAG: TIGR03618 family F420-dependent PPOX class oxidoreductase [Pseudonocardiaceae bacterium]|nr:TIGR03618 family F420-dependent PPOX class oxidoreductase [Pseudonocardiaceae bacterium]
MDVDEARQVVREQHHAVLATLRADGTPQMSPVLAAVDGDGSIVISSRETAYKVRHVRRNPRVWLCVLPDGFFGRWIQVDGRAEIVSLPEAMDGLIEYYLTLSGEHPNWSKYRGAMHSEQRLLIRITAESAGPNRTG